METLTPETPVARIDATGPIVKDGKQWYIPTMTTLVNGQTFTSKDWYRRLRDAKAALAGMPEEPTNMTATEYAPGKWLTTINVWIGPVR